MQEEIFLYLLSLAFMVAGLVLVIMMWLDEVSVEVSVSGSNQDGRGLGMSPFGNKMRTKVKCGPSKRG